MFVRKKFDMSCSFCPISCLREDREAGDVDRPGGVVEGEEGILDTEVDVLSFLLGGEAMALVGEDA